VDQNGAVMQLFASQQEGVPSAALTYLLDGKQAKRRTGDTVMNTLTKWEGDALLVNTLVSGRQDYTMLRILRFHLRILRLLRLTGRVC
jgi:hypothetical protein